MDPICGFCLKVVLASPARWRQLYLWPGFTQSCHGGVQSLHAQRQDQIQEFKSQGESWEKASGGIVFLSG